MKAFNRVLAILLACLMLIPSFVTVYAETKTISVDGVTLSRASSYLNVGDTVVLAAMVSPSNATIKSVEWTTSDESVATVENGVVTAIADGVATISAITLEGEFKASCVVNVSKFDIRNPETIPTPDKDSGEYITDILDEDKLMLLLPFDGDATDVTGNYAPVEKSTVTYVDGIHGKAVRFGDSYGYVEVPEIKFGTKSVSFATWVKKTGNTTVADPGLFGTQNWTSGKNPGFTAYWTNSLFGFNMSDGSRRFTFSNNIGTKLPSNIYDGWTHIAYVFDRDTKTISLYSDFKYVGSSSIGGYEDMSLDSNLTFKIGTDASATFAIIKAEMDDFFVYDGVLNIDDMKKLAGYYGFADIIPTESISIEERVYLLTGDTQKLVAKILPEDATIKSIEWTTSDESVATVENGLVTAISEGYATITATTLDGGFEASCKVYVTEIDIRNMATVPTPDKDGGEYITDILDEDKLTLLLPFDGDATDVTGNYAPAEKSTVTYVDGIHGKAIRFGDSYGYVDVPEIKFGTKSVSFATWVKKTGNTTVADPGLFGTQNWTSGKNPGFTAYWTNSLFGFNMSDGSRRFTFSNNIGTKLPSNIYDGWTHLAYVFDREAKTISLYSDFKYVGSTSISGYEDMSLDSTLNFRIGTDASATLAIVKAEMDDFFVYDGVLKNDDMTALAEYYGIKPAIHAESIAFDRTSLYLNVNEEKKINVMAVPEKATLTNLIWSSSDTSVATVDFGIVKCISSGEATISASSKNGDLVATCKVVVSDFNIRDMATVPTPDKDGGEYITDILDEDKLMLLLPFDGDATDVTGNYAPVEKSTVTYVDGIHGKAVRFGDSYGYVEVPEIKFGTKSVSFATWVKKTGNTTVADPGLFGTQNWTNGKNLGFTAYWTTTLFGFNMSDGSRRLTYTNNIGSKLPSNIYDGWTHIAYVFDRETKTLSLYSDFEYIGNKDISGYEDMSLDSNLTFKIGTDASATFSIIKAEMDDFFVYDGVLTNEDIKNLKDYYNASGNTISVDGVEIDRKSAYLCPTETIELTASTLPSNATHNKIEWLSTDESVATVDDGFVVAVAEGVADIVATSVDGGFSSICKIYVSPREIRNHESLVNPNEIGKEFLTDLFDEGKFKTFLTFENNAEDVTKNQVTNINGQLVYNDGFYGKAAKFNSGYVEFPELTLGTDNLTFGMWLKFDKYTNSSGFRQDTVFSTREISENQGAGFVVYATPADITQMFSDGTKKYWNATSYGVDAPADTLDGWVHLAYTIDRTNKAIKVYYDFKHVKTFALTDASAAVSFDGKYPLRLGTLKVDDYRLFRGAIDDFFIYDGVMKENDMKTLKEYYGLDKTVSVTGISLNEASLELDINESAKLVATVLPLNATHCKFTWSSSNPEIATVSNGKIRAESSGVTTITATTVDGGFVAECVVRVTENVARFVYDNVVIIGIDGAGTSFKDTPTPNIDRIFANGATTYTAQTEFPSISSQSWTSLLHGIENGYHGKNNSNAHWEVYPEDSPYPSIFKVALEKYPDADYASICEYADINIGMIEHDIPIYRSSAVGNDSSVRDQVVDYVKNSVPKIMYVHFGSPDTTGHNQGYGTQAYLDAITTCDEYVGDIYKAYEEQGVLDSTLFIVTPDHGGLGKNHGGDSAVEMNIFIAVAGRTVEKGTIVDAEIRDIAAITAYALGLDIPDTWTARVPDGVFKEVSGMERNVVSYEPSTFRSHTTEPTPSVDSGKHLTDIFDEDKFEFLLEFDENLSDVTGNHTSITTHGTITYEDGYFGKSAKLDEGYLTVDDLNLENENITIGTWIKARDLKKFGVLFSTGSYSEEGFNFYMNLHNFGAINNIDGSYVMNCFSDCGYYPIDFYDGWMHLAVTFNKETGSAVLYTDFKPLAKGSVPKSVDFNCLPVTIGMDAAHTRANLTISLDDFFLYNEAMSAEDIAKLGEYYTNSAEVPTPLEIAKLDGASLVLDGQIGIKVYADVNEELADRAEMKVVRINNDYECDADATEYSTLYRVEETVEFVKDETTGKYYTILYAPAKDIDNISFEAELIAYSKKSPDTAISSGNTTLSFNAYIEAAKKFAAEGNEELAEALPLIEALEIYSSYADNFFNHGDLEAYTTEIDSAKFELPQKSESVLTGAKFYGTSLILEDNVTIRHYFEVTDIEAFNSTYACDVQYKTKDEYIYFDIEDINAQDIDKPYKMVLKDKNSNEAFTVTYSVGNYIVSALNSSDTRLVSLAHAMYDYYIAANNYKSGNDTSYDKPGENETDINEW